jgi:hypothetical protein
VQVTGNDSYPLTPMTDLPIACTLTSDAMTDRLAFLEKLAQDGLIARESSDAGLRVRLRDTKDVERRTRQLIAAESSCCSFLTFSLERVAGELVLEIGGPDDARPVIDLFFSPGAA